MSRTDHGQISKHISLPITTAFVIYVHVDELLTERLSWFRRVSLVSTVFFSDSWTSKD